MTDIVEIACSVGGGSRWISLINTLLGMAIDINSWQPILANVVGGLSVLRETCGCPHGLQVAQKVKIPILGMGGISTAEDGVEFLLAAG